MEKKLVLALLMVALIVGGVSAQDKFMSAGGGFKGAYQSTTFSYDGEKQGDPNNTFFYGLNLFFDAKFVEVNVDYLFNTVEEWWFWKDVEFQTVKIGLVGKYPFALTDKFTLFPYAGIDYGMITEVRINGTRYDAEDIFKDDARLSILFGLGFDFGLTDALYLRLTAGYGIGLNTKNEQDAIDGDSKASIFTGIVPFKLAIGYRF